MRVGSSVKEVVAELMSNMIFFSQRCPRYFQHFLISFSSLSSFINSIKGDFKQLFRDFTEYVVNFIVEL